MSFLDRLRGVSPAVLDETERSGYEHTIELLESSLQDLERSLHEPGWRRLSAALEMEFTRDGLGEISRLCRVMRLKNPLVRRASAVKVYYVFGQGVEVSAKDDEVQEVVGGFVADPQNQASMFGAAAREQRERSLHTDANVFLACFTHPVTGGVQVRGIRFDEIHDVHGNPDDPAEPWFYERHWTRVETNPATGTTQAVVRKALYPDIDYRPRVRPRQWGGFDVRWDSPVLHVATNRPDGWSFGVPELYPALDWARAHAEFLDDFRKLVKVLSKFAYQLRTKGSQLERAKQQVAEATAEGSPAGQTFVADHGAGELQPMAKAGVSVAPNDARQFALMVSAATDIPETMLLGDPSTGNLATATTLDRPTELAMMTRQKLWASVIGRLCDHAIDSAVLAPQGGLSGAVRRDEWDRQVITLRGDRSRTVNVDWPPLEERSLSDVITALVGTGPGGAAAIRGMPDEVILRAALVALDVDDPDELVEEAMGQLDAEGPEASEMAEVLSELRQAIAEAGA